ncbi:MAG: saccharopine dehydrogenase NADP-binding domain-containing protein [Acidobacteria bacterium]|nr:saccharopine dehydrogenase NADP-binding domain-containing protein [Acidobacteriota bacterium]MCA1617392.1 saccharopine dehydrogenase NADP-binding domain-containing protein [Acidobacteriota bacterium]
MTGGLLLYGANGYTGRLILETALRAGLQPVIAGRRREAIEPVARSAGVDFRVFDLADRPASSRALQPFDAMLLAAGPFSRTSSPALDACLAARTAYLDITGEVAVFEALFERSEEAKAAGIAVLPGVGFDVVPTDCLAALLAHLLPDADRLTLAFRGFRPSPGTAKTMLQGAGSGGLVRIGGRLVAVPSAWKTRDIPFADRTRRAMTVPWGDLSTAWRSTGIPNIETYAAASSSAIASARRLRLVAPVLGWGPLRRVIERVIVSRVSGPSVEERSRERYQVWGRAEASGGRAVEGRVTTLEGYDFTAESAVASARRVLAGDVAPGTWTPAQAFGAHFVETIRGTVCEVPSRTEGGPP